MLDDKFSNELLERNYSADFETALDEFLATRGGEKWRTLHLNGPTSRMAIFERSTLREIEHHTGKIDGKRVLDFGCGTGTITPSLSLRAREVVAFDISPYAVDITRRRLAEHDLEHVAVHRADSFGDIAHDLGSFDLVIMHAVFEHVPASVDGLRERVRTPVRRDRCTTRPGGQLPLCR